MGHLQKYGTNDFTVVHVNARSLSKNRSTLLDLHRIWTGFGLGL